MFRAKMTIEEVRLWQHSDEITMNPKYSDSPEDNSYSKATPAGQIKLTITNPDLRGKLKPGQVFYVDFTPVPTT